MVLQPKLLIGAVAVVFLTAVLIVVDQAMPALAVLVVGMSAIAFLAMRDGRDGGALLADDDDGVYYDTDDEASGMLETSESLGTWEQTEDDTSLSAWSDDSAEAEPLAAWGDTAFDAEPMDVEPLGSESDEPLGAWSLDDTGDDGGLGAFTEPEPLVDDSPLGTFDDSPLGTFDDSPLGTFDDSTDLFGGDDLLTEPIVDDSLGAPLDEAPESAGGLFSVPAPIDETVESSDDIMRASEATELEISADGGEDSELAKLLLKVQARLSAYE